MHILAIIFGLITVVIFAKYFKDYNEYILPMYKCTQKVPAKYRTSNVSYDNISVDIESAVTYRENYFSPVVAYEFEGKKYETMTLDLFSKDEVNHLQDIIDYVYVDPVAKDKVCFKKRDIRYKKTKEILYFGIIMLVVTIIFLII